MSATERVRALRSRYPVYFIDPTAPLVAALLTLLGAVYLHWTPLVPDLAAQVARANIIHSGGVTSWWTGWFGGLSLPTYSLLVPPGMAVFGVRLTGLIALALGGVATTVLTRDALRPRAGAIAFVVAQAADLLDGRVTFTAGLALAAWTLVALRSQRALTTLTLAVATYFASPLAGLFLGLVLVAIALVDPARRRSAATTAGSLLVVGATMALMFPGTGTMPFTVLDAIPAALGCVGVLAFCPNRSIRAASTLMLVAFPLFILVPGAVGDNITRLTWVCAAPLFVACARLPRRPLVLIMAALAIWPVADLVRQLRSAADPSAQASFYQPLQQRLLSEQSALGSAAIGQRIEIVDTVNHWGSAYLSTMSLARGWDRQADDNYNPIFYTANGLNSSTYRHWLDGLAVGWVAVPTAALDYASIAEAKLIRGGLSYLDLTWSTPDWLLYRVIAPKPLATGARIDSVNNSGVTLTTIGASTVELQIRWSPYLTVRDPRSELVVPACVSDDGGWVRLYLPHGQTVEVASQFDPRARLVTPNPHCIADLAVK